jgi:5-methylthioribose kinase
MALSKNLSLVDNFGEEVLLKDAYIKVDEIKGGKLGLIITVRSYKNDRSIVLKQNEFSFVPSMSTVNFISQAYDHIKTLPEFAGATDC